MASTANNKTWTSNNADRLHDQPPPPLLRTPFHAYDDAIRLMSSRGLRLRHDILTRDRASDCNPAASTSNALYHQFGRLPAVSFSQPIPFRPSDRSTPLEHVALPAIQSCSHRQASRRLAARSSPLSGSASTSVFGAVRTVFVEFRPWPTLSPASSTLPRISGSTECEIKNTHRRNPEDRHW